MKLLRPTRENVFATKKIAACQKSMAKNIAMLQTLAKLIKNVVRQNPKHFSGALILLPALVTAFLLMKSAVNLQK